MSDDELRDGVSEITEISEYNGLHHFLASLCWSTIVGTVSMLIGFGWEFGFDVNLAQFGAALVFFGLFVSLFTFMGFVAIGMPITWLLKVIGKETAAIYAATGAITGFLVIALTFEVHRQPSDMLWFPAVGALVGSVCAYRWGLWREALANAVRENSEQTTKRSNPIHDLTH